MTISPTPGVLYYIQPSGTPGLTATFSNNTQLGVLQWSSNGLFSYTATRAGVDHFTYYATSSNGQTSNVATVTITNSQPLGLLPSTPYYNYLRMRRGIDPARFDFYHPKIGALLGMEEAGIPSDPTTLVFANKKFSVSAARALHAEEPAQYDRAQPVLGALFQLEATTDDDASLLPRTAYYNKQRAQFDNDPARYQIMHVYLGAIFALEDFEQTGSFAVDSRG